MGDYDDKSSIKSNNHLKDEYTPALLKRLKIQQNIHQKALKNLLLKNLEFISDSSSSDNRDNIELLQFSKKISATFTDIKNLYEEIRFSSRSDNIKDTDIELVKKDVVSLDTKIKGFKKFIQSELENLQHEEVSLCEKINENSNKKLKFTPIQNRFNIQSPVRNLIDAPFKYSEVQRFQEFMMKSPNRYGGWNEYNHNLFVDVWNAYYDNNDVLKKMSDSCEDLTLSFEFIEDVLNRIPGTNEKDIISHFQWYTQYLKLYLCQKRALSAWKENRQKIKGQKYSLRQDNVARDTPSFNTKLNKKQHKNIPIQKRDMSLGLEYSMSNLEISNEDSLRSSKDSINENRRLDRTYQSTLLRPTKQWLYRCRDKTVDINTNKNVEAITKLSVPKWRQIIS